MNKINQNKITFRLILLAISIIFSSITILCLPVLFNYNSKVEIIEKNFGKNFKIYLNSTGNISYKPFPKPHLLVEKASLNLIKDTQNEDLINTSNLKIFIKLRDIYLRSFDNFVSTEISNSNLNVKLSDLSDLRKHLYKKINKPIIFNNCKIFIRNDKKEVILISPIKQISYKINNKSRSKNLIIDGNVFGLKFKSDWKRNYDFPKISNHKIKISNPKFEINNNFKFSDFKKFTLKSEIIYGRDELKYDISFNDDIIDISSPNKDNTNFNLDSKIQLNPFYFEGELEIKNKKVESIIDNFLLKLLSNDENYIGNINGILKIKFDNLKNKLIKRGNLDILISEKNIKLTAAKINLENIGYINTKVSFLEDNGDIKFISNNHLNINNYIEFAKAFQIASNRAKKIKQIHFDLEKNIGETDFIIKNVRINNENDNEKLSKIYLVKNIQNLRSYIRRVID
jgi:hypothetical protein